MEENKNLIPNKLEKIEKITKKKNKIESILGICELLCFIVNLILVFLRNIEMENSLALLIIILIVIFVSILLILLIVGGIVDLKFGKKIEKLNLEIDELKEIQTILKTDLGSKNTIKNYLMLKKYFLSFLQ